MIWGHQGGKVQKKKLFGLLGALLLTANLIAAGSAGADTSELRNGEVLLISLNAGQSEYCYLRLPANVASMRVKLYDMQGDLDLYTRHGALPTMTTYDCRPYYDRNTDEVCYFSNPAAGTWYFYIHGYSAGSAFLSVTYETAPVTGRLINGEGIKVKVANDQTRYYYLEVPENALDLKVNLTGMNGDLDLYTRYNHRPTANTYDCRPYLVAGKNETCSFSSPQAGIWYFSVNGYTSGSATLTASYSMLSSPMELENHTTLPLTLEAGENEYFTIHVPADVTSLSVDLTNMNGDLDLYTRYGDFPDETEYECRPYLSIGSPETCLHQNPSTGTWYIAVNGYTSGSANLTVNYTSDSGPGYDEGELPWGKKGWSSWFWPWDDGINPNLYDYNEALYRYDLYTGSSDARNWEYNHHGPPQNPQSWYGSCHAWSGAACWHSQPSASRSLNGVQFRIRDLKGLMTAAYYGCGRGELHELWAYHPSPGEFWKLLQDEIKGRDPMHGQPRPFIADMYFGNEIWNHPIFAYAVNYSGSGTVSGTLQVRFLKDTSPAYADSTALHSTSLTYSFSGVRMNGSVPTDSGQWVVPSDPALLPRHRPDFVWRPYKASTWATYATNPELNAAPLKNILGPLQ